MPQWMKEIAPGTELRKWFAHDPKRCLEFQRRYESGIRQPHNDAVVLKNLLPGRSRARVRVALNGWLRECWQDGRRSEDHCRPPWLSEVACDRSILR
jgi:hypothetical protein